MHLTTNRSIPSAFRAALFVTGVAALLCCCLACSFAQAAYPVYDFAAAGSTLGWAAAHDVRRILPTAGGLQIDIGGPDPYIIGPACDLPADQPLWLHIRLKSEQGGSAQLFYFTDTPTEKSSVHFDCRAGAWSDLDIPLPSLGPATRFRFDPPGDGGACIVARMSFSARTLYKEPNWPAPDPPAPVNENLAVQSRALRIVLATARWNDFIVQVDGKPIAIGYNRPLIGVLRDDGVHWVDLGEEVHDGGVRRNGRQLIATVTLKEPDGAAWTVRQTFTPGPPSEMVKGAGAIDIRTDITVDRDRSLLYLPALMLLPGSGSFGANKEHALFAGLEYLDKNELSSSEADIIGPGARRQTPAASKITLPLMAIQNDGRYLALSWQPDIHFSALFDSPDRHFNSGGHVMGLIFPGSDGANRAEGSLLPYKARMLRAGETLALHATLFGGVGASVAPAVQQYVESRGLPRLPRSGKTLKDYVRLAEKGWQSAGAGAEGAYRHALPSTFSPQQAADAAAALAWLAAQAGDPTASERLQSAARTAIERTPPSERYDSGIGHIRTPAAALVFGPVEESIDRARAIARDLNTRFQPDGTVLYVPSPGGADLGRTHFAREANGLAAQIVATMLDAAAYCGDLTLIDAALKRLDGLDRFANSAPRGAQTWEVPLHTPDILASAHLTRAYTTGYALTGQARYLEAARYWAWTGVPFVYLTPPLTGAVDAKPGEPPARADASSDPIGLYATIAVYGATQWVAPNWMGLPVQWCGMVYAESLYRLARVDSNPIWKTLADGITTSGIQQSWPIGADALRQGLLPDSFNLTLQHRNDPAINPATVLVGAARLYTGAPLYDMQGFPAARAAVHAPGTIRPLRDTRNALTFRVEGWPQASYNVLVSGLSAAPSVRVDGKTLMLDSRNRYRSETGSLILTLTGAASIDIRW